MAERMNEKQAIINLQRYLRQLSYFDPDLPQVPVDGIFESQTQRAVEIFQQKNGLPVTGVANRETWDKIYQAYQMSIRQSAKPVAVDLFPRAPRGYAIRIGDRGFAVLALQYMLNELSNYYREIEALELSGTYNEETANAVRVFQRRAALPETGEVNQETWDHLTGVYNEINRHNNQ